MSSHRSWGNGRVLTVATVAAVVFAFAVFAIRSRDLNTVNRQQCEASVSSRLVLRRVLTESERASLAFATPADGKRIRRFYDGLFKVAPRLGCSNRGEVIERPSLDREHLPR